MRPTKRTSALEPWYGQVGEWIAPLLSPTLLVTCVLTALQEVEQHDAWYTIVGLLLINEFCVRLVTWLIGEVIVTMVLVADEWRGLLAAHLRSPRAKSASGSPLQCTPTGDVGYPLHPAGRSPEEPYSRKHRWN